MSDQPRDLPELTLEIAAALFSSAVLELATGDALLGDRLESAYATHLVQVVDFAGQLPTSFATRIVRLHDELTGGADAHDPAALLVLKRTLADKTPPELRDVARTICFLSDDLTFAVVQEAPAVTRMDWPHAP